MELAALLLVPLLLLFPAAASGEPAHPGYAHAELAACGVAESPERCEEFDGGRIIDISHYYRDDMPAWESGEGVGEFLRLARSMRNGSDIANFSELRLTAHSGTHVDAPGHVFQHYYDAGFDVDTLDLAVLNGPALLVDVTRDSNITVVNYGFTTVFMCRKLMWKKEFDTSYVGFMKDGAQWLVDNTVIKLVGVDYLSVGAFDECIPAHLVFLEKREVILVEALNLEHVIPGMYTLHCLPLRLRGSEGSPARCILIK
ncbi:hypothetical protein PR202_ga16821 [Eleusine coracana subsp. coracana]|uniref:Uncharacterized protein n=1 Tax=Eleusine coracana subsp. coracana TaxID=191504 RepID=A0AAV5CP94_ELECO|nr:hypothetical protein PR202_ga16821 [Eleusine coracana subsp. coracana]